MHRTIGIIFLLAAALLVHTSCGGGSSRDDSADITFDAPPMGALDGFMYTNLITPFAAPNDIRGVACGDFHWIAPLEEWELRGFVTFNIAALPAGAVVRAATLTLYQFQVAGDPYGKYGDITLDHVNLNGAFSTNEFNAAPLAGGSAFATLSDSASQGARTVDVRSQVGLDQVENRTETTFRLRYDATPGVPPWANDGQHDMAQFVDQEGHGGTQVPVLTIRYSP